MSIAEKHKYEITFIMNNVHKVTIERTSPYKESYTVKHPKKCSHACFGGCWRLSHLPTAKRWVYAVDFCAKSQLQWNEKKNV